MDDSRGGRWRSNLDWGEPIRWRLLTTRQVGGAGEARRVVDLYRMRRTIEEFFRTLKSAGFRRIKYATTLRLPDA